MISSYRSLEPVTVIILTNGLSAIRDYDLPMLKEDSGGELYTSCVRWDHRIITYIVNSRNENTYEAYLSTTLARLSHSSGGETHLCPTIKQSIHDLSHRYAVLPTSIPPTVTVDLSLFGLAQRTVSSQLRAHGCLLTGLVATLTVTHNGEWPIPEAQKIDRSIDVLPRRPSRPHLQVLIHDGLIGENNPGITSEDLGQIIENAKNTGLQPDVYALNVVTVNEKKRSLRLHQKLSHLDGIGENFSDDPEEIKDGCLGQKYCAVRLGYETKESDNSAIFGILCPLTEGKRSELLVFPYNFLTLLTLLQEAKEFCLKIGGAVNLSMTPNNPNSLSELWQLQMTRYISFIPPYYYPPLYKAFKSFGLHFCFSIAVKSPTCSPPPPDLSLSRPCLRQLGQIAHKAKADLCLVDPSEALVVNSVSLPSPISSATSSIDGHNIDSSLLEYNTMNYRGPISLQRSMHWKNPSSLVAVGITSSCHQSIVKHSPATPVSLFRPAIPHLGGVPPCSQDLLYTWEKIRSCVYGGTGLTVRGVFVAGLSGSSSGSYVEKQSQHQPDWFFKACGGATVPRLSVSCMSDYVSILSRKEALRDPELINPPSDEDQPQGVLKRKLSVNFGSPYKLSKKSGQRVKTPLDEPNLPTNFGDVTVTDDIFSLPSPDQSTEASTDEAMNAFSAPSSPLIHSGLNEETIHESQSKFTASEIKIIPKLKLKGKKVLPPFIPKQQQSASNHLMKSANSSSSLIEISSSGLTTTLSGKDSSTRLTISGVKSPSGIAISSPFTVPWIPPAEIISTATSTKSLPTILTPSSPSNPHLSSNEVNTSSVSITLPIPAAPTPPAGWIKTFSEKHKCDYWFNTITGVSQWIAPTNESTTI